MRKMAITFPARFSELASLSNADEEVDFFRNVAHIQLHRRSRALSRLVKARAVLCWPEVTGGDRRLWQTAGPSSYRECRPCALLPLHATFLC